MREAKASWVKTPNARVLYKTLTTEKGVHEALANSINALIELEKVVMEETRFQWANSQVFIYFFESPASTEFDKTPLWVAREVIGPPNEDASNRFGLHDLASGSCLQARLDPGIFEIKMPELAENYMALCDILEAKGAARVAKTWRIMLTRDSISSEAQIQLFPE